MIEGRYDSIGSANKKAIKIREREQMQGLKNNFVDAREIEMSPRLDNNRMMYIRNSLRDSQRLQFSNESFGQVQFNKPRHLFDNMNYGMNRNSTQKQISNFKAVGHKSLSILNSQESEPHEAASRERDSRSGGVNELQSSSSQTPHQPRQPMQKKGRKNRGIPKEPSEQNQ